MVNAFQKKKNSYDTSFVCEEIRDAAKLFWYGARSHDRPRNLWVFFDHPAEHHFAHVQIHTQTETKT